MGLLLPLCVKCLRRGIRENYSQEWHLMWEPFFVFRYHLFVRLLEEVIYGLFKRGAISTFQKQFKS